MAINEIHVGDVGTDFEITLKNEAGAIQDISGSSTKQIKLRKPDSAGGIVLTKTASYITDGTDGGLHWATTSVDDLDVAGLWKIQAYVVLSGGAIHHSDIAQFTVEPNLS